MIRSGNGVDQKLDTRLGSVRVEDLSGHRITAGVAEQSTAIPPDGDEPSIGQGRKRGVELSVGSDRIDQEFGTGFEIGRAHV